MQESERCSLSCFFLRKTAKFFDAKREKGLDKGGAICYNLRVAGNVLV